MRNYLKCEIKKLCEHAIIPSYATEGSVAFDLHSIETKTIFGNLITVMIHTGISVAIPEGYEMQVRQRSGLSMQFTNYIVIGTGTIDQDYRGEIMVPVTNNSNAAWKIEEGDRIAQAVITPVAIARFLEVDELPETKRGAGGFGHTG